MTQSETERKNGLVMKRRRRVRIGRHAEEEEEEEEEEEYVLLEKYFGAHATPMTSTAPTIAFKLLLRIGIAFKSRAAILKYVCVCVCVCVHSAIIRDCQRHRARGQAACGIGGDCVS